MPSTHHKEEEAMGMIWEPRIHRDSMRYHELEKKERSYWWKVCAAIGAITLLTALYLLSGKCPMRTVIWYAFGSVSVIVFALFVYSLCKAGSRNSRADALELREIALRHGKGGE